MSWSRYLSLATGATLIPAVAHAAPADPAAIFAGAAIPQKLILLGLVAATVAALAIAGRKLASRPNLSGGSAYLSGLRLGGPLAGLLGGAYAALRMSVGVTCIADEPTLKVLAPGIAEIAAVVALGFFAGAVAVVLNWAVEARLDRDILKG